MNKSYVLFYVLFLSCSWLKASELDTFFHHLKNQNFEAAEIIASNFEDNELKTHLLNLNQLVTHRTSILNLTLFSKEGDLNNLFLESLILGYQNTYDSKQNNLEAYKRFSNALKISEELENSVFIKTALIAILDLFASEIFIGSKQYSPFLERFNELKSDETDEALSIIYSLVFFTKGDDELDSVDALYYSYIEKLDSIFMKFPKSHSFYPRYYWEKGIYYKIEEEYDKSEDFFLKADSLASGINYFKHFRGDNAWQLALINMQNNKLNKAKNYLNVAKKLSLKLRDTFYNDRLQSLIFQKEAKYDSAYYYLRKSVDIEYQLGYKNNTLESSILTVQNQTDKLKLDKLKLDAENKKITNWATALATLLILGSAFAFLINSNTKRKQLLAEQGNNLQEQKVATLLKEQELTTIDAIIEGQEKERQRIANELHDDLGGSMATIKLYFNSLQEKTTKDNEALFDKTNILLNEAYTKIREIAHAKNSGVIAKQGLLKAVRQMGEKISAANRIAITVKDFGLDNRLENSLELTLFRIIQELVTNVIKHSQATILNIHLTNHGDILNILVEDNGIGFDVHKKMTREKGMGLKSIDKRIAHLDGTLHIESEPGKGATAIIDIPI